MNLKQAKVTIVKDDMGSAIRISKKNAEYAYVRLTQDRTVISATGWLESKPYSALIQGKTETLKKSGIGRMKTLPGNIYVTESHTGDERNIKRAGKTGIICCVDGEPIYRTMQYDGTGIKQDTLITHNNNEAIKDAYKEESGSLADLMDTATDKDPDQVDLEDSIAEVEKAFEKAGAEAAKEEEEEEEIILEDQGVEIEDNEVVEVESNVFTI